MALFEVRCTGTPEKPHPVHALDVTNAPDLEGFRLIIDAPQCSIGCACCQRAGSHDHAVSSLFRPGIPGGELPD